MAILPFEINLLPGEDMDQVPTGKVLKWCLTYGRYIVVVTELIVLLAFLSRFKLDRDLSDLSEAIARKKSIITNSASMEEKARKLSNRLTSIDQLSKNTIPPEKYLSLLTQSIPTEGVINEMKVGKNEVAISGRVVTEGGLATLVSAMAQNPVVKSVNLDTVSQNKDTGQLDFSMSIILWL
jgi:Tfp pilus assembly protein PilN